MLFLGLSAADENYLGSVYNKMLHDTTTVGLSTINEESIVTFSTFLAHTGTIDTPLARKIFKATDLEEDEEFELESFIVGLWTFCTLDTVDFGLFMFNLYLEDTYDTTLRVQRVEDMILDIHGKKSVLLTR